MTEPGSPTGGFRWVPPEIPSAHPPVRRRWWWALAALVLVAVLAGAGVAAWRWHTGRSAADHHAEAPTIGTPQDLLVGFALDRQPVTTWRLTPTDLGLPPDTWIATLFASDADNAYFLAGYSDPACRPTSPCANKRGWVYGIKISTGKPLFAPVELPNYRSPECHTNGPAQAVCLAAAYAGKRGVVWVVDLDRGELTFTSPTDLSFDGAAPLVPVGTYRGQSRLVIPVSGEGVYGVGSHGERTWFAPGSGSLRVLETDLYENVPAPTITTQASTGPGVDNRVFSLIDGTDLTPAPAPNRVAVYNGGFAAFYRKADGVGGTVNFYDTTGNLVTTQQFNQNITPEDNAAMPIVNTGLQKTWEVYDAAGQGIMSIPATSLAPTFKTIGTKLYVTGKVGDWPQWDATDNVRDWQQWDLLTGQSGATCHLDPPLKFDGPGYVGSDGNIVITIDYPEIAKPQATATDMRTCQQVWQTPVGVGISQAGTGLIQSNTDHSITGLRAP